MTQSGLGFAVAAAAGRCASFAINRRGALFAWGCVASNGLLPQRNYDRPSRLPLASVLAPAAVATATAVHAGEYHAMALLANGSVVVWGRQAGSHTPRRLARLDGTRSLAAGYQHGLALVGCVPSPGGGKRPHIEL